LLDYLRLRNSYGACDNLCLWLCHLLCLCYYAVASAQHQLGQGVTQDYKTGVKWYKLSAKQGNTTAQSNLGSMYGMGKGVIQDNVYAHMWTNISASTGHKNAVTNRDIVAKRMTSADISTAQKLARECVEKKYKGC
jgi:TPR repeat protein